MDSLSLPYHEAYLDVISMGSKKQLTWAGRRKDLTEQFGWGIPNEESIQFLVDRSLDEMLVEVGAGSGYWAHEIQRRGGNILPVDIDPPESLWTNVVRGSYTSLDPNKVEQLLLCWPPANSSMAYDCVRHLQPTKVYFIGVKGSEITGSETFHTLLDDRFSLESKISLPGWESSPKLYEYIR